MNNNFRKNLLIDNIIPKKINDIAKKHRALLMHDLENNVIETETISTCQCGSLNLEELSKIDRFGLPFGSLICQDCGLVSTSPRITNKSLPYYYNKYYHPLNFGIESLENRNALYSDGQGVKIFTKLKPFLPKTNKLNILEIGAGTGSVLTEFKEEAKKHKIEVTELGTEYSDECIRECQNRNINIIEGNIQTVIATNKQFDVIILSHVFEHFVDLKKELSDLRKLMHSQSLLYIEVPGLLVNHKKWYYDFSYLIYHVHAHMYNFTKETLSNLLSQSQFKQIDANEEVEAIYKLSDNNKINTINSYSETLKYLKFLDENNAYFVQESEDKRFYERQYYQQQQTIINRENTIQGKEALINKQKDQIEKQKDQIEKQKDQIEKQNTKIEKQNTKIEKVNKKLTSIKTLLHPIQKYKAYKNLIKEINETKS